MDFGSLVELVRGPLAGLLRARRDPKDLLAPSEAWIGSLEGLLREKHANFRPIRQLGRQGIPDPFRGQAWRRILEVDRLPRHLRDYAGALLTYLGTARTEHFEAPCFGSAVPLEGLGLGPAQLAHLKGLLCIIGSAYPNLEYTPIVPALVAVLLKYLGPDDVLGAMAALIKGHSIPAEKRREWAYFPLDRRDSLVFLRVFEDLVKKHCPKVWRHVAKVQLRHPDYAPDWERILAKVFLDIYPFWLVARIIDAFLVEGYKVTLRFAVAHVQLRKQTVLLAQTTAELDQALFGPDRDIAPAEGSRLIQRAYELSFSRQDICRYRSRNRKHSFGDFDLGDRVLIFHRPLPLLRKPSAFVGEELWAHLWPWVPPRFRLFSLDVVFATAQDGRSLQTLYARAGSHEPLLVLIEGDGGAVFGAFLSRSFEHRLGYHFYGTGESFLFRLRPEPRRYAWDSASSSTSLIMANNELIAVGAGRDGFGLRIDAGLGRVSSHASETYASEPLFGDPASGPRHSEICSLEVYAFV